MPIETTEDRKKAIGIDSVSAKRGARRSQGRRKGPRGPRRREGGGGQGGEGEAARRTQQRKSQASQETSRKQQEGEPGRARKSSEAGRYCQLEGQQGAGSECFIDGRERSKKPEPRLWLNQGLAVLQVPRLKLSRRRATQEPVERPAGASEGEEPEEPAEPGKSQEPRSKDQCAHQRKGRSQGEATKTREGEPCSC